MKTKMNKVEVVKYIFIALIVFAFFILSLFPGGEAFAEIIGEHEETFFTWRNFGYGWIVAAIILTSICIIVGIVFGIFEYCKRRRSYVRINSPESAN